MKHMITPAATLTLFLAAMLIAPTMAQAEIYSTLADRKNADGSWAVGYALGYSSAAESEREALAECSKDGLGRCTPLFTHAGPVCVAIAEGDDAAGWGGGGDVTHADAKTGALRKCSELGDNCRVTLSDCTGDGPVAKSDLVESNNGNKNDTDSGLWSLDDTQSDNKKTTTADSELWKLPTNKQPAKTEGLWIAPKNKQLADADKVWQSDTTKLRDDLAEWKRKEEARKAEERRKREEAARIARANAEAKRKREEAERIARAKAEEKRIELAKAEVARRALAEAEAKRKRQMAQVRQRAEEAEERENQRRRDDNISKGLGIILGGLTEYARIKSGQSGGSGYNSGGGSSASTAGSSACNAAQERAGRKYRELENKPDNGSICSAYKGSIEVGRIMESVIPACSSVWSSAEIRAQREAAREYIRVGKQGLREACGG